MKFRKANKNFKIASILAVVFCLSTLAFFFKSVFLDSKEDNSNSNVPTEQTTDYDNGGENATEQPTNQINLNDILVNDDNRNTLNTLLQNIKEYEKSINKKKYSDAIIRDANILGLDKSFIEKYQVKQDENSRLPENENNKKNEVSPLPIKKETQKVDIKKDEPKKVEPKKEKPKKEEPKKVEPIKEEPKKEEPKKVEPKKVEPIKEEPKKEEPKKDK